MQVDLAVAIAQKRESAGLSQSVAAKRAHLTQQQMSKIENGENCTIYTYLKAMEALDIKFKDLAV